MYLIGLVKNFRTCDEFEMQEHMKKLMSCFQEYNLILNNWVINQSFSWLKEVCSFYLHFFIR